MLIVSDVDDDGAGDLQLIPAAGGPAKLVGKTFQGAPRLNDAASRALALFDAPKAGTLILLEIPSGASTVLGDGVDKFWVDEASERAAFINGAGQLVAVDLVAKTSTVLFSNAAEAQYVGDLLVAFRAATPAPHGFQDGIYWFR